MTAVNASGGALDFGAVIDSTFKTVERNLASFIIVSGLLYGVPSFLMQLLVGLGANGGASSLTSLGGLIGLVVMFTGTAAQVGLIQGAGADLDGGERTAAEMIRGGLRLVLPALGLVICLFVGVGVGLVLLVVPGVVLAIMWSMSLPVLALEGSKVFAAFPRSAALTKGARWQIFLLMLVLMVGGFIASALLGLLISLPLGLFGLGALGMGLGSAFISCALQIVGAAGSAVVYHQLKATKEGPSQAAIASVFD